MAKAERDKAELKYTTAVMDGRVEKVRSPAELLSRHLTRRTQVGNFRVEPPGLFRGRGEHPKMGMIKVRAAWLSSVCVPCGPNLPRQRRIQAEDIIINIGKDSPVPAPPPGHSWKAVIHNQYVSWLAGWKDSINTKDWKCVLPTQLLAGTVDLTARRHTGMCSWVRRAPSRARATNASMRRCAHCAWRLRSVSLTDAWSMC